MTAFISQAVDNLITLGLSEDLSGGDITTESTIEPSATSSADIVARQVLIVCGLGVARRVFERVDSDVKFVTEVVDGEQVEGNTVIARASGSSRSLLMAERLALNFLQRLSGIATQTRRYADKIVGYDTKVVDTRKTTPGWRYLEKMAVRAGGGHNHRFDLSGGILLKDNHIHAAGSVALAVERARANAPHSLQIEIEVTNDKEFADAIEAGAGVVLLDNMEVEKVKVLCKRAHEAGVLVEVSGGITLDTIEAYAAAGADIISVGALTHSASAADLAMDFVL